MADAGGGGAPSHEVQSLLSSPDRDFLVRNNGDQVKLGSLLFLLWLFGKTGRKESWVGVLSEVDGALRVGCFFADCPVSREKFLFWRSEAGEAWSFFCKECDFDLHPKCAVGEEKATKNKSDEDNEAAGEEAKEGGDAEEGWVCDGEVCYKA
ncbi:hypothetical protein NL676_022530 [Syzygium grande]|nr:hypothetical protein NL676_022530 [Syzygium grande]